VEYQKLELYISKTRLDRFLNACNGCEVSAQRLYQANLKVAESFYSVLNLFEVFLRNNINNELSKHFGDQEWILSQKNGFMSHSSLTPSKFYLKSQVLSAEKRLAIRRKTVTSGLVIAEQSLGFWTSLFETHHYRMLSGCIIHCFPNRPNTVQRKEINFLLNDIRDFRNRVYHNEPVCFNGTSINFDKARKIREDVYNILNWMDTDVSKYTSRLDNIPTNISLALQVSN
jgi:hypothetical protein